MSEDLQGQVSRLEEQIDRLSAECDRWSQLAGSAIQANDAWRAAVAELRALVASWRHQVQAIESKASENTYVSATLKACADSVDAILNFPA